MKVTNLPSGSARTVETGLVWKEVFNGAGGFDFELPFQSTFRVSAGADVTVTLDGVLAMTMRSGEVERFNVGSGQPSDGRSIVKVAIGTGDARVQVALELDPGRRSR